jgi:arylsulfatase A-like enzyme
VSGTLLGRTLYALQIVNMRGHMRGKQGWSEVGADELFRRLFAWLDGNPEDRKPWFGYVHAIEPHTPYAPPEPFRGRFADPAYDGPEHLKPPFWKGFLPFSPGPELPEAERQHMVDRYDEEILTMDAALGRAVEELRRRGQFEKTIVVVVSDHGEEFYDHGGWGHGRSLYEEQIRVPMLIRVPGVEPRRIETPVRAMDLYPTLFGLTGLEPKVDMPSFGEDLTECIRTGRPPRAAPIISEVHHGGRRAHSIVDDEKKLIEAWRMSEKLTQAFDIRADPGEREPLERTPWSKRHGRRLEQTLRAAETVALPSRSREITPEERDALRGLGYID